MTYPARLSQPGGDLMMPDLFSFNHVNPLIYPNQGSDYSLLKLFIGLAIAAFIAL